ncbi:methylated-DNA--[protein]-cysteine S-methyltransferase [Marinicrinis lubricantis]|uniref:Methylated-DNA--[protein]-cysteine S-methyltransferase n=1 Tax=Marinicrinis lubricantis TaxID=2086470 RepID=A0ABW1INN4_9BACL
MNRENFIRWTQISIEPWQLYIAASPDGLCYIGSPHGSFEEAARCIQKVFPVHSLIRDEHTLQPFAEQIIQYAKGKLQQFTFPLDLKGTPFQLTVWKSLCCIPYGHSVSYSDIAEQIGKLSAVRAVGTAIGANPLLIAVPCHRVIGKNGALTGYRGGIEMKSKLLQLEQNVTIRHSAATAHK